MVFTSVLQNIQDDYECSLAQYDWSTGTKVLDVQIRLLDATTFLRDRGEQVVRLAVLKGLGSRSRGRSTGHLYCGRLLLLVIVADGYDDPLAPSRRTDRFICEDYSYSIAHNGKSGIVMLLPEGRALIVSGPLVGYVRIRVIDSEGRLLGAMTCSDDGHVSWSAAVTD
jgi:hypothetical protein